MLRTELEHHLYNHCPEFSVDCECGAHMKRRLLGEHYEECPLRNKAPSHGLPLGLELSSTKHGMALYYMTCNDVPHSRVSGHADK